MRERSGDPGAENKEILKVLPYLTAASPFLLIIMAAAKLKPEDPSMIFGFGLLMSVVMMAFARPLVISAISSGPESLLGDTPSLRNQGAKWFLYYAVSLIMIHHFTLFYLEIFRFNEFLATFVRVLLSSAFTLMLVLISEYLLYPRGK